MEMIKSKERKPFLHTLTFSKLLSYTQGQTTKQHKRPGLPWRHSTARKKVGSAQTLHWIQSPRFVKTIHLFLSPFFSHQLENGQKCVCFFEASVFTKRCQNTLYQRESTWTLSWNESERERSSAKWKQWSRCGLTCSKILLTQPRLRVKSHTVYVANVHFDWKKKKKRKHCLDVDDPCCTSCVSNDFHYHGCSEFLQDAILSTLTSRLLTRQSHQREDAQGRIVWLSGTFLSAQWNVSELISLTWKIIGFKIIIKQIAQLFKLINCWNNALMKSAGVSRWPQSGVSQGQVRPLFFPFCTAYHWLFLAYTSWQPCWISNYIALDNLTSW